MNLLLAMTHDVILTFGDRLTRLTALHLFALSNKFSMTGRFVLQGDGTIFAKLLSF